MEHDFPKYAPLMPGQEEIGCSVPTGPRLVLSLTKEWIPVIPVPETSEEDADKCTGCIGNDEDTENYTVHCRSLPNCSDVIYVHPTPENMARWVANQMEKPNEDS